MPTAFPAFLAFAALLITCCSGASGADLPPQSFSADIVRRNDEGIIVGPFARLRVWGTKTRIDASDNVGAYFLTDSAAGTALFVRPAQHLFMDAKRSTPLTRIFVRVDPRDPCRQWQAAALIADEANAETWLCRTTLDAVTIDPVLQFPTLWRSPDGSTARLENIRVEYQPTELFVVPADCRKLDPSALLERIKRSDVWAPAPQDR
jgi:hypothetical protein